MPAIIRRYLAACASVIIGVTPIVAHAASETVVYSFKGPPDGAGPQAGLTNVGGTLYGTTYYGGVGQKCYTGGPPGTGSCGTAFSLTQDGTETVLYSFGQTVEDAAYPHAKLIDVHGALYSTAYGGINYPDKFGNGTVFKLTLNGAETVLFDFSGDETALDPNGIIKVGRDFYGTTVSGSGSNGSLSGTVFSMSETGVLTVLYAFHGFEGTNDGALPHSGLIHVGGKFFGSTYSGGPLVAAVLFFRDASWRGDGRLYIWPRHWRWRQPCGGPILSRR